MTLSSESFSSDSNPDGLDRLTLVAAVEAEVRRRDERKSDRFTRYRDDGVAFVENVLLGFAWSKQIEIIKSVQAHRRTAVKACHGPGKSRTAASIGAHWLSCWPPGESFLVSLAPTAQQVRAILWREIGRIHKAGSLPGYTNQTEWHMGGELVGYGRSPADNDPTAIQGIHAARVLVIVDEACGVGKPILDAASTMVTNDESRMLMIGNPDDPSTEFAQACKPGSGWNVITISAFDCPAYTGEVIPAWLRPLLVSKTWVEERRKSWGEGSPMWISKVLGEFPEQADDGLISASDLNAACNSAIEDQSPIELGVDVARYGGDSTVIYCRRGPVARRHMKTTKQSTMVTVGNVILSVRETGATMVKVDDSGVGGGVTDRLLEIKANGVQDDAGVKSFPLKDCQIIPINVGEGSLGSTESERFKNLKAEINWKLRDRFVSRNISLPDASDELKNEALQVKYEVASTGIIQMEKKEDMKERLNGRSPDEWDALVLAFAAPNFPGSGMLEYIKRQSEAVGVAKELATAKRTGIGIPVVTMIAPAGISTAYGITGKAYLVGGDGRVVVDADDAVALRNAGFRNI